MKQKLYLDDIVYEETIENIIKIIKANPEQDYYKIIDNNKIKINNKFVLNTQFICHRVNKIEELENTDKIFGVEIDIRDDHKTLQLILAHDPYVDGEFLDAYLSTYNHNTLILNIKSERVEIECLEILRKYNITNYFFLDSSFPMINLLNNKYSNKNIASRFSEYECLEFTKNIKDMVEWIWIDCFTYLPLDKNIYDEIKSINKKTCIVSPELQGQKDKIHKYREQLINNDIIPDAICCKIYNIYEWI